MPENKDRRNHDCYKSEQIQTLHDSNIEMKTDFKNISTTLSDMKTDIRDAFTLFHTYNQAKPTSGNGKKSMYAAITALVLALTMATIAMVKTL